MLIAEHGALLQVYHNVLSGKIELNELVEMVLPDELLEKLKKELAELKAKK